MGICCEGRTLKQAVAEKERSFKETGYAYGLKDLKLVTDDPAKFMRFQLRLVAACINARETAKLISANPVAMLQGELLFMLATPEGDCVAASYGLAGHIQAFPFIVKSIANLDFEEDPAIEVGDVFATNDAYYGAPHNADNYNWVPVFHEGVLIAWTVGLNHIVDVGGLQPGNLGTLSPNTFTDGFIYPPTKIGAKFKTYRWWELHWKRRTRTEVFNILDDKMRTAGAVSLHDKILEIVEEFGIDYFRQGLKEIIERERRVLVERIRAMAVPGRYDYLHLNTVNYKNVLGTVFPRSNRNWLLHEPAELNVLPDGKLHVDLEGLTSEADFHCNGYEAAVRMLSSLGCWPLFAYTVTLNTALQYMTSWNLPPGSMFNPQNPYAATVMSLAETGKQIYMFHNTLSLSYFARGFLEECFPGDPSGVGYGLAGILADGFQWGGGDMTLVTCWSSGGFPYKDGEVAYFCSPNPAPDQGETEAGEFLQPTNLTIGKKLIPNYCGHGKFRGGLGIGMCQMIVDPGQFLMIAGFGATGGMTRVTTGNCGGYPGLNDINYFAHDTNMREILAQGKPYPRDFVEIQRWIKDGRLKAGSVDLFKGAAPNIPCKDGDLFASATSGMGGWGDPLERDFALIEKDVHYGWITPDVATSVYGAITDDKGKVKAAESQNLRKQMRDRRKERSVDAKEWWRGERDQVLKKEFTESVRDMYADCLRYPKFRRKFMEMWQLPKNYEL